MEIEIVTFVPITFYEACEGGNLLILASIHDHEFMWFGKGLSIGGTHSSLQSKKKQARDAGEIAMIAY